MMARRWRAVPALAVLLGLAACGSSARQVGSSRPDPSAYPVVAAGQAGSVLDAVEAALAHPRSGTGLDARLVGPYRQVAQAQALVAAVRKRAVPGPAQVQRQRLIVPLDRAWPRFFVTVGHSSAAATPVLWVLSSASARAPYGLWAQATMLPGATLPQTAPASAGSPLLAPDAPGFIAAPAEVVSRFASYLNHGARTSAALPFQQSSYGDQVVHRLAVDRDKLKVVATVTSTHAVAGDPPLAVRTSDGSALVIGELVQRYVITVRKGKGSVKVSDPDLAALDGGKQQFGVSLTRTAVEVIVFAVPAEGKGLITVVAAQKSDVRAVLK